MILLCLPVDRVDVRRITWHCARPDRANAARERPSA